MGLQDVHMVSSKYIHSTRNTYTLHEIHTLYEKYIWWYARMRLEGPDCKLGIYAPLWELLCLMSMA